jgi:hypothetical protein
MVNCLVWPEAQFLTFININESNQYVWNFGLNLLHSATSKEDKQAAILYMIHFQKPNIEESER